MCNHDGSLRLHRVSTIRNIFPILAASLTIPLSSSSIHAECPVERVGQWGGASLTVAVQGDYAYAGIGAKLVVLDISDPQSPALIGSILTRGTVTDIALSGQHAFVCTDNIGLEIIDISNPAQPTLIGEYWTAYQPRRVIVQGQYAFVLSDNIGFHVVDISNPAAPVRVGQYNMCCPMEMAVFGNYIYILSDYQSILLDLSNPISPVFVSNIGALGGAVKMRISGNRLYAVWNVGAVFRIFDISTPTAPVLLGYEVLLSATNIDVVNDLAYVTTYNGLVILDVSNPADPVIMSQTSEPKVFTDVRVLGDHAVVSEINGVVGLVDVSDPQTPQLEGNYRESGPPWNIVVSGTHAYLSSDRPGPALEVLNLTNPAAPTLAGQSAEMIDIGYGLAVQNDKAYLATPFDGLMIFDISNPSAPNLLGEFTDIPSLFDIAVEGTIAYLIGGGGLFAVDVSNPSMPSILDEFHHSNFESAEAIATLGNTTYVVTPFTASFVIDSSVPSSLSIAGSFPDTHASTDINVSGSRAYILDHELGLTIYDINDPMNPIRLSSLNALLGYKLAVRGDFAYLNSTLVDVSDPTAPTAIGSFTNPGFPTDIDVLGSYVYIATYDAGVTIFRTCIAADMNCDSVINGLDVAAFTEALLDQSSYQSTYPFCNFLNADVDQNGDVDESDIVPFVERVLAN